MRKLLILVSVLILATGQILLADTGSGDSAAGSLTSMPPAAPALDSPSNEATGVLNSEVGWNSTLHAASYNLQVSTVSDFNSTIADETGLTDLTFNVSGLSGSTKYYWHVSATNVAGTSDYSGTWDFTTDASLSVTLISFSAEIVDAGILIQWATESETENLGFILERNLCETESQNWQVIATYQTHAELTGQGNTSSRTEYTFTDVAVQSKATYQYRLSDVSTTGEVNIYDIIQVSMPDSPEITELDPPFPNPFNPQTKINYQLSDDSHVEVTVFDLMGRTVQILVNGQQSAGSYNLYWNGQDNTGNPMASGTYFILLKTAGEIKTQKAVLLR